MGFYKKVKFPFEVTKGKSRDLFQLRFMRKSELEPIVRHNLKHSVGQMGRQLELWYKEQLFTIGYLNKAQEKVHQSRKRLKIEIRRSKKREYERRQEEIRIKLKDIRMKMLMMKVVQKFKDNVSIARSYRQAESSLKGNVDILRVSGNKQLIHCSEERQKSAHETQKNEKACNCSSLEGKQSRKDKNRAGKHSSRCKSHAKCGVSDSTGTLTASDDEDDSDADDEYDLSELREVDEAIRLADESLAGQRYPSSHGPRMETIPEEIEEVDIEIASFKDLPKLTQTRLSLLNRSQSKRNIFDAKENVPLLPEVTGQHMHKTSHMGRHLPDTADKETQTSDKSKSSKRKKASHLRRNAETTQSNGKRTIVVKLPLSKPPSSQDREQSAKSNSGHYGSEDSDDDYNDETTDTDFAYGFESDLITSETDDFVEHSEDDDEESLVNPTLSLPEEFSFTLTKYKTTLRRKAENNTTSHSFPKITNLDASFPDISSFSVQNPYSLRYKERSFYVKPFPSERLTGSATLERKAHECFAQDDKPVNSPRQMNSSAKKNKREEIKKLLTNNSQRQEQPNIAIYGRKPDGVSGPQFPSPPDTPAPNLGLHGLSPRRVPPRTNQASSLYTQKRAKAEQEDKIHDIVSCEPVQRYERTRSGKIRPFGTPRVPNHEIPSLKEQYYREKLLKAERDTILRQNIKMKRFLDTFDKGSDTSKLPTASSSEDPRTETSTTTSPARRHGKTLGNILFKVHQPEQHMEYKRKVVPGVSTTSLRLLKNCRYLREYKPLTEQEQKELHFEKETSWNAVKTRPESNKGYLANVRVNLV